MCVGVTSHIDPRYDSWHPQYMVTRAILHRQHTLLLIDLKPLPKKNGKRTQRLWMGAELWWVKCGGRRRWRHNRLGDLLVPLASKALSWRRVSKGPSVMKFKTRPKRRQGQALLGMWCFASIKHDGKFVVVQQLVWHRCQRSLRPRTCIFMLLSLYSNFDNKS